MLIQHYTIEPSSEPIVCKGLTKLIKHESKLTLITQLPLSTNMNHHEPASITKRPYQAGDSWYEPADLPDH